MVRRSGKRREIKEAIATLYGLKILKFFLKIRHFWVSKFLDAKKFRRPKKFWMKGKKFRAPQET